MDRHQRKIARKPGRLVRGLGVLTIASLPALGVEMRASPVVQAAGTTFSYTGGEQSFVVPPGVTTLHVVATGASGADNADSSTYPDSYNGFAGGGAQVTADISVTPNQTLYIEVGGSHGSQSLYTGGWNGGGSGEYAGGGATDIRTCSIATAPGCPALTGSPASDPRILVAGGGGGGASFGFYVQNGMTSYSQGANGGNAGNAPGSGESGQTNGYSPYGGAGGAGGAGASQSATGAGGAGGSPNGAAGGNGTAGTGGTGGTGGGITGAGGGGGWFGGGGGGGGGNVNNASYGAYGGGGGGGGGSSYVRAGSQNVSYAVGGKGDGQLVLTYPGPTAAVVSRATAQRQHGVETLSWRVSSNRGLAGFAITASGHRVNAHLIPVHRSRSYVYQIPSRGPFTLRTILTTGGQISSPVDG